MVSRAPKTAVRSWWGQRPHRSRSGLSRKPKNDDGRELSRIKLYRWRELSDALSARFAEINETLIREEVHGETADAEERDERRR